MGLDILIPLGLIFLVTGAILLGYGAVTYGSAIYDASMGINLNLRWGAVMAVFGGAMLLAARRA